jgi:DNA-binding transcriptional LysR family regulator
MTLIWPYARRWTDWGSVLKDWSPSFEGLFLYYPGHRQVPAALRALIDMIKAAPGPVPEGHSVDNSFAAD